MQSQVNPFTPFNKPGKGTCRTTTNSIYYTAHATLHKLIFSVTQIDPIHNVKDYICQLLTQGFTSETSLLICQHQQHTQTQIYYLAKIPKPIAAKQQAFN